MGMHLGDKSFKKSDYVLQPQNGGSGFDNIEDIINYYGLSTVNDINKPGGVLGLVDGKIPSDLIGNNTTVYNTVGLIGPSLIQPSSTNKYIIGNYIADRVYTAEFTGGYANVVDNEIYVTASSTPGDYKLRVGNEEFDLKVAFATPTKPSVTATVTKQGVAVSVNIQGSDFQSTTGLTHVATDWQISTSPDFNIITAASVRDRNNKLSISLTISTSSVVYIRARYLGSNGEYSQWSDTRSVDTSSATASVGKPTVTATGTAIYNSSTITAAGSAFVATVTGYLHLATNWKITDGQGTVLFRKDGDNVNLTSITATVYTTANVLYVSAQYVSNEGATGAWSDPAAIYPETLGNDLPVVSQGMVYSSNGGTLAASRLVGKKYFMHSDGTKMVLVAQAASGSNTAVLIYMKKSSAGIWSQVDVVDTGIGTNLFGSSSNTKASNLQAMVLTTSPIISSDINTRALVYRINLTTDKIELVETIFAQSPVSGKTSYVNSAVSQDGELIALARHDNDTIEIYEKSGNYYERKYVREIPSGSSTEFGISSMDISPNKKYIAVGDSAYGNYDGRVIIFRTDTPITEVIETDAGGTGSQTGHCVRFDASGEKLYFSSPYGAFVTSVKTGGVLVATLSDDRFSNNEYKLVATGDGTASRFGYSFGIAGNDRLAIGAVDNNLEEGAVFLYSNTGEDSWKLVQTLRPAVTQQQNYYGNTVSITGDGKYVATSSGLYNTGAQLGVELFGPKKLKYTRVSRFCQPLNSAQRTGAVVAVSKNGKFAAVMSTGLTNSASSTIHIFAYNGECWEIIHKNRFKTETTGTFTGSLAFNDSGNVLAVGYMEGITGYVGGAVIMFDINENYASYAGVSSQSTQSDLEFGKYVCFNPAGNECIIAAANFNNIGVAYYYRRVSNVWTRISTISPTGLVAGSGFGTVIKTSADMSVAVISAPGYSSDRGTAQIFTRSGDVWTLRGSIEGYNNVSAGRSGTGLEISSDGKLIFINGNVNTTGAVTIFESTNLTTWSRVGSITIPSNATGGKFGNVIKLINNETELIIPSLSSDRSVLVLNTYSKKSSSEWVLKDSRMIAPAAYTSLFDSQLSTDSVGKTLLIGAPTAVSNAGLALFIE